jgi:cell shape-determining protein MreC
MRRAFSDVLMSMGAMSIVLIVLIAFDGQLRDQVRQRVNQSHSPTELVAGTVGVQVREVVNYVVQIVRAETEQHATLVLFMVAASILTLFMVRT